LPETPLGGGLEGGFGRAEAEDELRGGGGGGAGASFPAWLFGGARPGNVIGGGGPSGGFGVDVGREADAFDNIPPIPATSCGGFTVFGFQMRLAIFFLNLSRAFCWESLLSPWTVGQAQPGCSLQQHATRKGLQSDS
jgi:hypothetical protein